MEQRIDTERGAIEVDLGVRGKGKLSEYDRKRSQAVTLGYALADYLRNAHSRHAVFTAANRDNIESMLRLSLDLFEETNELVTNVTANDNGVGHAAE